MSQIDDVAECIDGLEKALRNLDVDLLSAFDAFELVSEFSRGEKVCASGRTLVARVVNDAKRVAHAAGIPEGEAAQSVAASHTASEQPELDDALRGGGLSGAQANAVARGAKANPRKLKKLLHTAKTKSVNQLRDEARDVVLNAKDPNDRYRQQRAARSVRTWTDDLGMLAGSFRLTPEVGAAVKSVLEREGKRLHREAKRAGTPDHYPAYLADALADLVSGGRSAKVAPRAEVVVDISYEALMRGWAEGDEMAEIRGLGPIPVWRVREIMEENAFLKAVVTQGTEVAVVKHFGRHIPAEIKTALEWRHRVCVDCGSSWHLEDDHKNPCANGGETSYANIEPRCWPCHRIKTEEDRRNGLLGKDPPRRRE